MTTKIKNLIDNILKDNKSISLEKIQDIDLSESEHLELLDYLKKNNIEIEEEYSELALSHFNDDALGKYLTEIGQYNILTKEEEKELAIKIKNGDDLARTKFIESNLKLVVSIAKHYSSFGVPLLDLIQDGNIGLIKALNKFDASKGYKFSTYATWWIKQYILRGAYDKSRIIRIPVHSNELQHKIKKYIVNYQTLNGREPSLQEISKEFNISVDHIKALELAFIETLSLDAPIKDESGALLIDCIEDDNTVESELKNIFDREQIYELLNCLSEREKKVIILRYGLENGKFKTLEEIGLEFNITRERIRQIEAKAFRKIRNKEKTKNYQKVMNR